MLTIWFYIYVYTKWLKRRTWQNVIWGGAAGCMPVIVGWAATTDNHGGALHAGWSSWIQAIILFMIIFFWIHLTRGRLGCATAKTMKPLACR